MYIAWLSGLVLSWGHPLSLSGFAQAHSRVFFLLLLLPSSFLFKQRELALSRGCPEVEDRPILLSIELTDRSTSDRRILRGE